MQLILAKVFEKICSYICAMLTKIFTGARPWALAPMSAHGNTFLSPTLTPGEICWPQLFAKKIN